MTKKSVIISLLVLLIAFLLIGILNTLMGRPSLFTDKLSSKDNTQKIVQKDSDTKSTAEDYSYVTLENILKSGMSGDGVKRVQYILKQKGFYNGDITGNFDDTLKKAVTDFQKSCKLEQSGIVNMDTISALTSTNIVAQMSSDNSKTTSDNNTSDKNQTTDSSSKDYKNVEFARDIYPGMSGDDVKKSQYLLELAGYYKGEITGIYDDTTKKAVIAFQMDNGITKTGNVGKKTQAALTK